MGETEPNREEDPPMTEDHSGDGNEESPAPEDSSERAPDERPE